MFNFFRNISTVEIIVIATILMLIFGKKAFVSLGKTSGESYKEIKKIKKNLSEALDEDDKKKK